MSSVEQKIREVLENISGSGGVKSIATDQATQSILQIIESDVIAGKSWHTCYDSSKCNPQYRDWETDRKSTRLNSSHSRASRMPSSA